MSIKRKRVKVKFPVLYKRNTNGSINQWQVVVKGSEFWSIEGIKDGALTESKPTVCTPKNEGRANATTAEEQAIAEAQAKMQKKRDKGYTEDIKNVDTCKTFFSPMLAHKYKDYKNDLVFPVYVSRKIDGARLVARADGLWTRNGKKYVSCPHIAEILKPFFAAHADWVIDSEIYSHEVPFEQIMSLVRRTKPTAEELALSKKLVKIYVFDGVAGADDESFDTRFMAIKSAINETVGKSSAIVFVENEIANNHADINKAHEKYIAEGFEGVMIRIPKAPYENKRSKNLLKHKAFIDSEYTIVDVEEGKGNRSGMAGMLKCSLADGRVFGAGIRGGEAYYAELLKNRAKLLGKKCTVRYQELSADGIPRFPVAVAIDPIDR